MSERREYLCRARVLLAAFLTTCVFMAFAATPARADDPVPTAVTVTRIAFKDASNAYLPTSDSNSEPYDLVAALADDEVSTTKPAYKSAQSIEVTVKATVKTGGVDTSVSKVEVTDDSGNVIAAAPFVQKEEGGSLVDYTYVATVSHPDADATAPLPEKTLGIKVTFKDTEGKQLEATNANQQLSESDKYYQLFGASIKEFDVGGTPTKKVYADGSLVFDRTAPTLSSMTVSRDEEGWTPTDDWTIASDVSDRSGTATINLSGSEVQMDATKSSVTLVDLDDASHPETSVQLSWDDTAKKLTYELPDGHWSIQYKLVDAAGNVGSEGTYSNVTVDGTVPQVSYTFRGEPVSGTEVNSTQLGQIVMTVRDPHFDLNHEKTAIFVHKSYAEEGFSFNYSKSKWNETSSGVYTYAIDFDYEGSFVLVLNGMDTFGNFAVTSLPVIIDGGPPVVTTQVVDGSGNEVSSCATITSPFDAEVFDEQVRVRVTVVDHWIDSNNSTIALQGTNELWFIPLGECVGESDRMGPGCTVHPVSNTNEDSVRTIVFDVIYPTDHAYYTPVVRVTDKANDPVQSRPSDSAFLLIDTTSPVLTASISEDPLADLGSDAAGNTIPNGAANGDSESKNYVYFYKCGETAQMTLAIKEACGLKTLELTDDSGRYVTSANLGEIRTNGNGAFPSSTTFADIPLASNLKDGVDFSNSVKVVATDFAGHSTVWSITMGVMSPGGDLVPVTLLVEDDTDPVITVSQGIASKDVADAAGGNAAYVRYFNESKTLQADYADLTLKYLRGFAGGGDEDTYGDINGSYTGLDPQRPVVTIVKDGAAVPAITVSDLVSANNGKNYSYERTFAEDGAYEVTLTAKDVVGNEASETIEKFVIDKTAPTIAVSYDNNDAHNGTYYAATRTATITVKERNFDPELFEVAWDFKKHAQGATEPSMSAWTDSGDTHTCTVSFPSDGEYVLTVEGVDKANNVAVLASDSSVEGYDSGTFTIDTEQPIIAQYYDNGAAPASTFDADDPVVEFPAPTGTYDGTNYYAHEITLPILVKDRNIDAANTATDLTVQVTRNGKEGSRAVGWARVPDERGENGYEQWQTFISFEEDGEYRTPHVKAKDLADNSSDNDSDTKPFVIDLNPPEVAVHIDHTPASQGISGNSGDPVNFYNESTKLALTVTDEHLLRSVEIVDPDSNYTITKTSANAEGKKAVTLVVQLKDGTPARDAEYQRDIVLTAIDLAGNERTWTIDHNGKILKDELVDGAWKQVQSAAENASVDGEHPKALVQDTVAPVVSLSGVEAGKYYNKPQTVVASIHELNLDWLKQFDPSRTVVTVTKYEGNASRAMSSWTIPASSFTGSRPNYTFSQLFSSDGHYIVTAQFLDYATNLSNKATIGEFTIDMTAPTIQIEFDNNDVRNGKYYKATRTATITVKEHNFSADLIKIETNGSIGGWSSSGDTHICTVFFGEGGSYNLKVGGKDLAGNEAQEVTVEEFIVDLTVPEVTIAGTAQRLGVVGDNGMRVGAYHDTLEDENAYNGVVVPVITYKDNEVLSAEDLSFALTGSKHGKDTVFEAQTSPEDKEMTISFSDLGYKGGEAGDGSNWRNFYVSDYESDADDIYTLSAKLSDQAGNEAEAELTFSVNRFGSNYDVRLLGLSEDESEEYKSSGILWESPTIVVREINVSGVGEGGQHRVEKEFANVTSAIKRSEGDGLGYALATIEGDAQANGWSEYVYTVRSANFGKGSDSDHDDRGQGVYRVNVTSDDASSNANTTAEFWSSDAERTKVTAAGATAQFVLDELGPTIEDLDVPAELSRGATYEASFHVNDDITSGNTIEVYVDGKKLGAGQVQGPANGAGTFTFTITGKPFNWARSVRVVVRDYAGREASISNGNWFWQSTFLMEGGVVVMALAVVGILAYAVVHRMRAAEPELPML